MPAGQTEQGEREKETVEERNKRNRDEIKFEKEQFRDGNRAAEEEKKKGNRLKTLTRLSNSQIRHSVSLPACATAPEQKHQSSCF